MPVVLRCHETDGFLEATVTGHFSLEDIQDALGVVVNSTDWPPSVNVLWDATEAHLDVVDQAFVDALGEFRSNIDLLRRDARTALLVPHAGQQVSTHVTKMFSNRFLAGRMMAFHDRDEAILWLKAGRKT